MALKLRRGTDSGRSAITPAEGEPIFTTDTKKLYVGDGSTVGGIAVDTAVSDGDKGDITVSSSGATWTIDNDAVTYAKMQNVSAASRLLGRGSASGSGDMQELTIGAGLTLTGTELSASSSGGLGAPSAIVTKSADETVSNSSTLQYDDELVYNLDSGKSYYLSLILFVSRANNLGEPRIKLAFAGNSNGFFVVPWNSGYFLADDGSSTVNGSYITSGSGGTPTGIRIDVYLKTTSAFTAKFKWAQAESGSTGITVMKNSRLLIWDLGS